MIETLLAQLGWKISKRAVMAIAIAIVICVLMLMAGLAFRAGMTALNDMETRAATTAREERNAHWRAEIEKSNAEVERRRAEQAIASAKIETESGAQIARLNLQLSELERANASLPHGDRCGISRARVRLLRQAK